MKTKKKSCKMLLALSLVSFAFAFLLVSGKTAMADEQWFPAQDHPAVDTAGHADATNSVIRFYRKYISNVDGDRCPMYPSCSTYSGQAIQKHGLLMGWIMTCDRLVRCGRNELKLASPVKVNGRTHSYDPLGNNDFWW